VVEQRQLTPRLLALFVAHAERQGRADLDVVRDQFEQLHGVPSAFGRSLCR